MPSIRFPAAACAALLATVVAQPAHARDQHNGAAAGTNASNASTTLEKCDKPYGTLALVEDQGGDWYRYLTTDLRLGSTVPLLRLMAQQSNCFVVVERGRAMNNMMGERALADSGEMREGSSFGKGQIVAADYTLNPSIQFATSDAGGVGGFLSAFGGKAAHAGTVLGGLKFKKASTFLALIDNRSGVQLAASEGNARKTDFNLAGAGYTRGSAGGLGGYTNTPEGKVIAQAFADAYNQMVVALRGYRAQDVDGGLGKGGSLKVGQ
jgi:curli biogenesis system outer membrane secretion channel CsgG